jgi:hypothetical protein
MENIFNSDLTGDGYDAGFNDGKEGLIDDSSGSLKHWKTWSYGDNALSTWAKGYNRGYLDGCAKRKKLHEDEKDK